MMRTRTSSLSDILPVCMINALLSNDLKETYNESIHRSRREMLSHRSVCGLCSWFSGAHTQGKTLDELNENLKRSSRCSLKMDSLSWKLNSSAHRRSWWPRMGKIPLLKPQEVAAILLQLGFQEIRQRGSHKQYRHADGRGTTVPFHTAGIFPLFCSGKSAKILG